MDCAPESAREEEERSYDFFLPGLDISFIINYRGQSAAYRSVGAATVDGGSRI